MTHKISVFMTISSGGDVEWNVFASCTHTEQNALTRMVFNIAPGIVKLLMLHIGVCDDEDDDDDDNDNG